MSRSTLLTGAAFVFVLSSIAIIQAAAQPTPSAPPGVCDSSDALDLIRLAHDHDARASVHKVLSDRLTTCSKLIAQRLQQHPLKTTPPTAPPWSDAPPPPLPAPTPEDCTKDPQSDLELYGNLVTCATYWKNLSSSPSSTPAPPALTASQPTFYVFATGTVDATTNAMLIRSFVRRLTEEQSTAESGQNNPKPWAILGRTDWTSTATYATQCQNDSNTQGAIVIEGDYPVAYANNYLLVVNTGEQVRANIELLGCDPLNYGTALPPLTLLSATDLGGKSSTSGLPLGVWGATAVLFSNNHQTTTTTVTVTPPPPSPAPPPPKTQTTVTSTSSDLTPALAANALATSLGSVTTPTANAPWLLSNSAWRLADNALAVLNLICLQKEPDQYNKYKNHYVNIPDFAAMNDLRHTLKGNYPSGSIAEPYVKGDLDHYRAVFGFGADCEQFDNFPKTDDSTLNTTPIDQSQ